MISTSLDVLACSADKRSMSECANPKSATGDTVDVEEQIRSERVGYVARQPILDRRGAVFGYALHFHGVAEQRADAGLSPASRGLLDALALFGVERFTGGAWGFVACTPEVLMGELMEGLPTQLTVLEIPRCAELSPKLLRACRNLAKAGFRLALAEFEPDDPRQPLLPEIDYVKVDMAAIDSAAWGHLRKELYGSNAIVVGQNIHAHDDYCKARAAGVQYFQGYYFCHPELIPNGKLPIQHAQQLEILQELFKDPLDLKSLCPLVSRDPSLVYRVLRLVNSPICAVRLPVTSIELAIMILGDAAFRRMATLAIQCTLSQDQSPELLRMALLRARFCAQAAPLCGLDAEEMYLLGMLSVLPAMLQVSMETILQGLPLRSQIHDALSGCHIRERSLLFWLEDLDSNNISGCEHTAEEYGLDTHVLAQIYLEAMQEVSADTLIR